MEAIKPLSTEQTKQIRSCPNPAKLGCASLSPRAEVSVFKGSDDEFWQVICPSCGVSGPIRYSKDEAIEMWNKLCDIESLATAKKREEIAVKAMQESLRANWGNNKPVISEALEQMKALGAEIAGAEEREGQDD